MSSRIALKVASTFGRWRASDLAAGIAAVVPRPDGEPYASTPVWIWESVVADAGLDAEVDLTACQEIAESTMHAYDGRRMLGTVLRMGRSFVAFDLDERHTLTTTSIREAMRSLTAGGAHAG